jgi:hypothetical protein
MAVKGTSSLRRCILWTSLHPYTTLIFSPCSTHPAAIMAMRILPSYWRPQLCITRVIMGTCNRTRDPAFRQTRGIYLPARDLSPTLLHTNDVHLCLPYPPPGFTTALTTLLLGEFVITPLPPPPQISPK